MIFNTGAIDYSLEFESELWKYALQNESALALPQVVEVANKILQATLGIHRGNINVDNCFQVFNYWLNILQTNSVGHSILQKSDDHSIICFFPHLHHLFEFVKQSC